ncbi:Beige/beach protein-related, partial [Schistosoma japonicum]
MWSRLEELHMSMDEMREMEEISENSNDHSKDIIVNIDQNDIIGSIPFEIYTSNVYNERDSLRIVTTTAANVRNVMNRTGSKYRSLFLCLTPIIFKIFNDHSKSLELDKWTPNLPELKSDFFEKFKIYRAIPHGEWQVFLNNQLQPAVESYTSRYIVSAASSQSLHHNMSFKLHSFLSPDTSDHLDNMSSNLSICSTNCEDLAQHSLSRTRSQNLYFNSHMDASAKRDGLSLSDLVHLRMQPVSVGSYNCGQTLATISVCKFFHHPLQTSSRNKLLMIPKRLSAETIIRIHNFNQTFVRKKNDFQ